MPGPTVPTVPTDIENLMAARNGQPDPDVPQAPQVAAPIAPGPVDPNLPPVQVSDPFAQYRDPKKTFDITDPSGKTVRATIDQLTQDPTRFGNHQINVLAPDGSAGTVPFANVEHALARGYQLETAPETFGREQADKNSGWTGAVRAAVLSGTNELFLGVPDVVRRHTQDDFQNATEERIRKEHGLANAIGATLGFAGSTVLGGTLFKGAAMAGSGAAKLAERGIAEGLSGRLLGMGVEQGADTAGRALARSMVQGALKLGTEGAIIAAPKAITEAMFSDKEAAAETLLYTIGAGAALGSLGSGAMELFKRIPLPSFAAGAVAPAGLPSTALDAIANRYANKAAAGQGEEVKDALTRAYATDAQRVVGLDDVLEHGIRKISDAGTPVLDAEAQLADVAFTQKSDQMGAILREVNLADPSKIPEQWMAGGEVYRMTKAVIDSLNKSKFKGGIEGGLTKTEKYFEDFQKTLARAKGSQITNPEDMFIALDKLKRQVGKVAQFGKQQTAIPEGAQDFDDLYHGIRTVLEREPVWGKAAVAQREVNQAYTASLATRSKFEQSFVTQYGATMGRPDYVFDPKKVSGFLNSVGSEDNALVEKSLRDYAEGMRSRIKAIRSNYSMTDAEKAIVDQGETSLQHLEATVDAVKKEVRSVNQIEKMKKLEMGKGIGGLSGLLTDYLTRPLATAERLGHVAKWTDKFKKYANDKIGPLVIEQSMRKAAQRLDEIPEALNKYAVSKEAVSTLPAHVIARFMGEKATTKTREEQFTHLSDKLAEFHADPVRAGENVGHLSGVFQDHGAPEIGNRYNEYQLAMLAHLHEVMPKAPQVPVPFTSAPAWKPSRSQLMATERHVDVARDPFVVIDHLANGTLAKEHIETLQQTPRLHNAIKARIAAHAASPEAPKMSAAKRARLSMLIGEPLDTTQSGARFQASFQTQPMTTSQHINVKAPGSNTSDVQRLVG